MWNLISERLPEIPKDKHGITILVCNVDEDIVTTPHSCIYASTRDHNGKYYPKFKNLNKEYDFMELYIGGRGGSHWGPLAHEVSHWMYMPDPPTKEEIENMKTEKIEESLIFPTSTINVGPFADGMYDGTMFIEGVLTGSSLDNNETIVEMKKRMDKLEKMVRELYYPYS